VTKKRKNVEGISTTTEQVGFSELQSSELTFLTWTLIVLIFLNSLLENLWGHDSCQLPRLTLLKLSVIFIFAFWFITAVNRQRLSLPRSSFSWPLLTFLLVNLLATLNSIHSSTSLAGESFGFRYEGLWTTLSYIAVFFALFSFINRRWQLEYIITALFIGASLVSIYGIAQHFGYDFVPATMYGQRFDVARSFATFGSAAYFGAFLALILPVSIVFFVMYSSPNLPKWLTAATAFLSLTALLFTYTRAAWLGGAVSLLIFLFFLVRRKLFLKKFVVIILLVILAGLVVTAPSYYQKYSFRERIVSIFRMGGESIAGRLLTWQAAVHMVADRPVLGSGPDTFGLLFPKYRPSSWFKIRQAELTNKAHNNILQVATTTGILGLLAYLWLILVVLVKAFSIYQSSGYESQKIFILALGLGIVAYLVQLQFSFMEVSSALPFWYMLGLLGAVSYGRAKTYYQWKLSPRLKGNWLLVSFILVLVFWLSIKVIQPIIADRHLRVALDSESSKRWIESISEYRKAASYPDEEYLLKLADAYASYFRRTGDIRYLGLAKVTYQKVTEMNSFDWRARIYLANILTFAGRIIDRGYFREAAQEYQKVTEEDPYFAWAYFELSRVYHQLGEKAKARKSWQKAVKYNPRLNRY
jgi:O-antigen ligase